MTTLYLALHLALIAISLTALALTAFPGKRARIEYPHTSSRREIP